MEVIFIKYDLLKVYFMAQRIIKLTLLEILKLQ